MDCILLSEPLARPFSKYVLHSSKNLFCSHQYVTNIDVLQPPIRKPIQTGHAILLQQSHAKIYCQFNILLPMPGSISRVMLVQIFSTDSLRQFLFSSHIRLRLFLLFSELAGSPRHDGSVKAKVVEIVRQFVLLFGFVRSLNTCSLSIYTHVLGRTVSVILVTDSGNSSIGSSRYLFRIFEKIVRRLFMP